MIPSIYRGWLFACLALLVSSPLRADVLITEFMASNRAILDDEDGQSSDWIEIFNSGPAAVDLAGYHLTDNPLNLTEWQFPATTLQSESFLVVFASGKDRAVSGAELHTNFGLSSDGDYLALVEPDGTTIASEYAPTFPQQFEDFSYGRQQTGNRTVTTHVSTGDACRWLVPASEIGQSWTATVFDDSTWTAAQTGIGYEGGSGYQGLFGVGGDAGAAMQNVNTSIYCRVPFTLTDTAGIATVTLRMKYDDGFIAYLNGVRIAGSNDPGTPVFDSAASGQNADGSAILFEDFDITAFASQLNAGDNVLAIHGLNDGLGSSDMLIIPELAIERVTNPSIGGEGYLAVPSPGAFNGDTFEGFVLDTQFSIDRGFYDAPISVEITTLTPDAIIRYTTDGSDPTEANGTTYDGSLTISSSTTLRAFAYKAGLVPTNIDTQTYLFLDDIITQYANGAVPPGWPANDAINGQDMNYGMDPDIVGGVHTAEEVKEALRDVPTLSVVTPIENLVSPSTGIYVNPGGDGRSWERPASIELINADGSEGFQINAGLRIRGGFSRSTGNPKHSFRILFRRDYGDSKLRFPLFGDEGTDTFDNVDLRTSQNYSWAFGNDSRNSMLRDVWSRDLQGQLGHRYTKSRYYHLYLNGLYWGIYMTQERAEASFAESYFGGDKSDYDVIKSFGAVTDGNRAAHSRLWTEVTNGLDDDADYFRVQGMNPDGTRNPAFERLLDVDNLIDYMIITYHTGDRDGPGSRFTGSNPNNFYTIFNRTNPDGFKYFEHDSEHSMGTGDNDMTFPFVTSSGETQFNPHWMHEQIVSNDTYRRRFADRVQALLFNDGLLTPEAGLARIDRRAAEMDKAIIAESARWGDSRRATPYTRNDWLGAADGVRSWVTGRNPTLIGQLRARGWFPGIDAPSLNRHGGEIAADFDVLFVAPSGVVYYTTDGSDPQNDDGSINAGAQVADPAGTQVTVLLDQGAATRALVPTDGSLGDAWRALVFNDSSWQVGTSGVGYDNSADYIPLIGTDIGPTMEDTNASVYIRIPFSVADPDAFTSLTLRMKYDDGYVAYINGTQVASANSPANPAWNASALGNHDDAQAQQFIDVDITARLDLLNAGSNNVLAIHGLNTDTGSSDMLILPRLEGGVQSGGTAVNLPEGIQTVRTRALQGDEWSALTEARFLVDTEAAGGSNIVVTKVMYHAGDPTAAEIAAGFDQSGDFDYIELLNIGALPVDLSGAALVEGIDFVFPEGTLLQPGDRILVVENLAAFDFRYGAGLPVAGQFAGTLDNGGEQLAVADAEGATFIDFTYDDIDPWPVTADGQGFALMLADPGASPDPALPASWIPSASVGGNPGSEDTGLSLAAWRIANFGAETDPLIIGDDADPDGDGLTNLGEFALVSDPNDPSQRGGIEPQITGAFAEVSFRRIVSADPLTVTAEFSLDGVSWSSAPPLGVLSSDLDESGAIAEVYRLDQPMNANDEVLFRVRVTSP